MSCSQAQISAGVVAEMTTDEGKVVKEEFLGGH